jgi:hypothetical protein
VTYLFDNAVIDRNARIATGWPVEGEYEFADRLWLLLQAPPGDIDSDDELLDTFLDRKRILSRDAGAALPGVLVLVTLVGAFLWGWTHSAAAPNGATLLAVLILATAIAVPTAVIGACRRADRAAAAYTARVEGREDAR